MKSLFEKKISLNGDWSLFFEENKNLGEGCFSTLKALKKTGYKAVPAKVPGNFEIDLQNAGLLDDIFFGENPLDAQKRENYHLWYVRKFTAEKKAYNLVFDGIDTVISERGSGLSEGQVQRIAIARALLSDSEILLLDESTSAVDEETEAQLVNNLKALKDKTVIFITHRSSSLKACQHIVKVENGKIFNEK